MNEYLVDMNATAAAIRAGYCPRAAKSQASRLLTFVNVKSEIQRKQTEDENRLKIDREKVLGDLVSAIDVARKKHDPMAMIQAVAEINKMMGYYQ